MSVIFPLKSFLDQAFLHALAGGLTLTSFKSILATLLIVIAVCQVLEQALLSGWIRVRNLNVRLLVRLHLTGGLIAVLLVLMVLGSCLYTWLGLGYSLATDRVAAHVVLGGLVTAVLLTKVAIVNRYRQYMRWTLPLGATAATCLLGIFLLMALPYFMGRV